MTCLLPSTACSIDYYDKHYNDVIMSAIASQITSLTIVCSTVYSDADQRKHHSSALLAFGRGIHRGPVNSPHKWPVTRKMFPLMTSSWYERILVFPGWSSYQYRKFFCGDKTVVWSSYPHNRISYTDKMASLYWTNPQCHIYVLRKDKNVTIFLSFFIKLTTTRVKQSRPSDTHMRRWTSFDHLVRLWIPAYLVSNHYSRPRTWP